MFTMLDGIKPDYTNLIFPDPPPQRPYIIVNMVMSTDGKVVVDRNEYGLSSPTDKQLLHELRVHADAVLNGAETMRVTGSSPRVYEDNLITLRKSRGLSANPIGVVLSRSGDLPLDSDFFTLSDFRSVVFLNPNTPKERRRALVATGCDVVELPMHNSFPWMLHYLRDELFVDLLLVEGGPCVNGNFFDQGFVDEFFLTLSPCVVSGNNSLSAVRSNRDASPISVTKLAPISAFQNSSVGDLYLRYRVLH